MNNYSIEFLKNGDRKIVQMDADNPEEAILLATISSGLYDYSTGITKLSKGGKLEDIKTTIDWDAINEIKDYINENDNGAAYEIAKNLPLATRNIIPAKTWLEMGGELIPKVTLGKGGIIHRYTYTDENENEIDLEINYEYQKYIPATYLQPSEGGYAEILSIKNMDTGEEVEVPEDVLKDIEQEIDDIVEDSHYNRGFSQGGEIPYASAELWFYEPPQHDKVYNIYLRKTSSDGRERYGVEYEFGRRGSALKQGYKIIDVSFDEALKVLTDLIEEKKSKGYKVTRSPYLKEELLKKPEPEPEPIKDYNYEYVLKGSLEVIKEKNIIVSGVNEYGFVIVKTTEKYSPKKNMELSLYPINKSVFGIKDMVDKLGVDENILEEIATIDNEQKKYYQAYEYVQSKTSIPLEYYFGLLTVISIGKIILLDK